MDTAWVIWVMKFQGVTLVDDDVERQGWLAPSEPQKLVQCSCSGDPRTRTKVAVERKKQCILDVTERLLNNEATTVGYVEHTLVS